MMASNLPETIHLENPTITSSYESVSPLQESEPEYQDPDSSTPPNPPETKCLENQTISSSYEAVPPSPEAQPEYQDPDANPDPSSEVKSSDESPAITITSSYETILLLPEAEPEYQNPDPDPSEPLNQPETKHLENPTITSSNETAPPKPEPVYEYPFMPPVVDGSLSEFKVKPKPRPRSKLQAKPKCNTKNGVHSVDEKTNTTNTEFIFHQTSQHEGNQTDHNTPHPVCPPSSPHSNSTIYSKLSDLALAGSNRSWSSVSRPRPQRPPPPAIYSERLVPGTGLEPQSVNGESQRSRIYSSGSAGSQESANLDGTYSQRAPGLMASGTDRPAVPPRPLRHDIYPSLPLPLPPSPASYATLPPQLFSATDSSATEKQQPSPPPYAPFASGESPSDTRPKSIYNVIDHQPYLELLPEGDFGKKFNPAKQRSMPHIGLRSSNCSLSSYQPSIEDSEELSGMLRWLKRMERAGNMA
ncbi:hypothetical protein LDENG_00153200, partial [Lucifuga dentata]